MSDAAIIGVISDTHGLLRDGVVTALQGSELIIHAGDVGELGIIDRLRAIAPVVAVRGNIDKGPWAARLPEMAVVEARSTRIYVLHDLKQLSIDPPAAGFDMVVSGHSHKPVRTERSGVIYLNPGSAGPRRFRLPVTVARLDLRIFPVQIEFIDLLQGGPLSR